MRRCKCGVEMVKESGCLAYLAIGLGLKIIRKVKPVTFWSCYTCGHCEEH